MDLGEAGGAGFAHRPRFVSWPPPAPLRPFVERLWYYESRLSHPAERVLPSGRMQLIVHLEAAAARLCGPMTRPVTVPTVAMRRVAGALFRFDGARPFLSMPCAALTNLDVDLADLWGRDGAVLAERLAAAVSPAAVLHGLWSALVERLSFDISSDPIVRAATVALARGDRVAAAVDASGLSWATFGRRFADRVGLSPKRYAGVQRFQRVVGRLAAGERCLASVAAECGYYDQPHLSHEFRRYSGLTPGAYAPRSAVEPNHVTRSDSAG